MTFLIPPHSFVPISILNGSKRKLQLVCSYQNLEY